MRELCSWGLQCEGLAIVLCARRGAWFVACVAQGAFLVKAQSVSQRHLGLEITAAGGKFFLTKMGLDCYRVSGRTLCRVISRDTGCLWRVVSFGLFSRGLTDWADLSRCNKISA